MGNTYLSFSIALQNNHIQAAVIQGHRHNWLGQFDIFSFWNKEKINCLSVIISSELLANCM